MVHPLNTRKPLHLAVATALATLPAMSSADVEHTEKVVVTGQSTNADVVIGSGDLSKVQAQNLSDIFRKEPSVQVGGGGTNTAQKIYVRGLEDTQLNVTIDGAYQSGTMFHHQGRLQIEPELLKEVEVEAGAGAATSGPGALGGSIRFTTKDPEDLIKEGNEFGGLVKASYGNNADYIKVHTTVAAKASDTISVMASWTQADADNYQDGNGDDQAHTPVDQKVGLFKLHAKPSKDQDIRFSHSETTDEGTRNFRANQNLRLGANDATPLDLARKTTTLNYNYNPENDLIDMELTLYRNEVDMKQTAPSGFAAAAFGTNTPEVVTYGMDLRNTSIVDKHSLTYGFDYRDEKGSATHSDLAPPATGWTGTRTDNTALFGLYLQDNFRPNDDWLLSAGLRYDHGEFDSWDGHSVQHDEFSPNASATYFFNQDLNVRLGYAIAHRTPSVREAYIIGNSAFDPNITSEKAENIEIALNYEKNGLTFDAEIYRQDIKDPHNIYGYANETDDIKIYGYALQLGYEWENLSANFSVTDNDPEKGSIALYDAHPHGTSVGRTWMATLDYSIPQHNLSLGWNARLVEDLEDVPAGSSIKEGYDLHDVYAEWKPNGDEDLTLTFSVNNLFGELYYDHATQSDRSGSTIGNYEQGRDIRLSVAYQF
ncbi:TonB-dependent receptor domain-containing protein [Neptuniibacter caesariensis]|uniref:Outer membrane protein n=1 Tax=Neptuniibacter caesariensis TaxID=207954 RepID=A0A7U8GQR6_NEPCE|nr:TonB-dependent receptor [Neptuniibacter caesariensis]EAR59591.1 Outer membrane protein [Oceanospirillum sp. MED92] [Neptuniibacter caesariensis]